MRSTVGVLCAGLLLTGPAASSQEPGAGRPAQPRIAARVVEVLHVLFPIGSGLSYPPGS